MATRHVKNSTMGVPELVRRLQAGDDWAHSLMWSITCPECKKYFDILPDTQAVILCQDCMLPLVVRSVPVPSMN